MVNPIFGVDVSGISYMQETNEGSFVTGTYRFIAPELRSIHQESFTPYPVQAGGSVDIADFATAGRIDQSTFFFDLTASGIAYLKDGINVGGTASSGTYWSHSLLGRIYSQDDQQVKYWRASGAHIDTVFIAPGVASWQIQTVVQHKPVTITGAANPAGVTITEWPGAASDPILNPNTVSSGSLFTFNGTPWYIATLSLRVNNNNVPIPMGGEQNVARFSRTLRSLDFMVAPYDTNLSTYRPALNTVGTGILTLATGRTITLSGLYFYDIRQLPFQPTRPATLGMVATARTLSLAG
jgi:hypothetical protein